MAAKEKKDSFTFCVHLLHNGRTVLTRPILGRALIYIDSFQSEVDYVTVQKLKFTKMGLINKTAPTSWKRKKNPEIKPRVTHYGNQQGSLVMATSTLQLSYNHPQHP